MELKIETLMVRGVTWGFHGSVRPKKRLIMGSYERTIDSASCLRINAEAHSGPASDDIFSLTTGGGSPSWIALTPWLIRSMRTERRASIRAL